MTLAMASSRRGRYAPAIFPHTTLRSGIALFALMPIRRTPRKMKGRTVAGSSVPLAFPKAVVSGTYQASTTINGVKYTSSFVVDAAQVQAKVGSITQTGSATSSDVAASWTAGAGATSYQMLIGDSTGFKKSAYTTDTNAALSGMSLVTTNQNFIFVGAMNFKFDAGLDVVAPAQFNIGFNFKQITF